VQLAVGYYHNCAVFADGQLCVPPRPPPLWMGCFRLA